LNPEKGTRDKIGKLRSIWLAPRAGELVGCVEEVKAVEERGLEGDRYYQGTGSFSRWDTPKRQVSLIAFEQVEKIGELLGKQVDEGSLRRNLVTEGIPIEQWAGATFSIGEVLLKGLQPCAPCRYLERILALPSLMAHMKGRGGLRAQILKGGYIRVDDPIVLHTPPTKKLP